MASSLCKLQALKSTVFRSLARSLSAKPSQTSGHVLDEMFSESERERILECFNKCSPQELQFTKQLSQQKALALVQYREKNGDYCSLSEILRVPGVGILGLQKLCTTMKTLDYEAVRNLREKLDMETVKPNPPLPESLQEDLSSLVAVELHADSVAYAQMSRTLTLERWELIPLFEKPFQRVDHVQFLDKLLRVIERLPKADVYAFESKIYRYTNLRVVPYVTNLRILEAMLVTLLNADLSTTGHHKAFFLKPNSVMRFFKLAVGGERVSGQYILRELQRNVFGEGETQSLVTDVDISVPLWEQFLCENSVGKERLTNTLLLAVAFYKLVVLRTHSLQF